jgi:hypothetical protein
MNAIAYAQYQLAGGHRKLARWVIAFAVLTALGIVVWMRTGGGLVAAASAARIPLTVTLGVLLVILVNMRIAGAIKRDNMLDMSRSHRLMPQSAPAAILGYLIGPSVPVLAAAGVMVLAGVVCTLVAGGNPAAWLAVCGILLMFALMSWCLTAAGSFSGKPARGEKPKGGIGWVPWVILGPSLGTGGALLVVVPWLAVILSPLIGQTVFSIRRVEQISWAHAASGALQAAFAAVFFAAACRRYRRDDLPAFSARLWLYLMLLIVLGSLIGISRFNDFRPGFFDQATLILNVAVPATLTLLLLMLAAPLGAAESEATGWRYRRNTGDPLADESRPQLRPAMVLVQFLLLCAPLAIFTPDVEGMWQYVAEGASFNPLIVFERGIWLRTWSLTGAAFACCAVLIWSLVRIGSRVGGGRFLLLIALILWLTPLIAAGVWAFRQDAHLGRLLNPIASFSSPGTIWTVWCGTTDDLSTPWGGDHIMTLPAPWLWPGVAFQAAVALVAVIVALRVPDRAAEPVTRE